MAACFNLPFLICCYRLKVFSWNSCTEIESPGDWVLSIEISYMGLILLEKEVPKSSLILSAL